MSALDRLEATVATAAEGAGDDVDAVMPVRVGTMGVLVSLARAVVEARTAGAVVDIGPQGHLAALWLRGTSE